MGCDKKIIKIGVNGSRGVGCLIIMNLLLQGNNKAKLVAINEPSILVEDMAALFNYLCPEGQQHVFKANNENTTLQFGQNSVIVHAISNPEEIPWAEMGVEYVIESTGSITVRDEAAAHLRGGAKKVIITDISKDVPMFVFGVNEKDYKPDQDDIVSSASLITHHLAPILEVFQERFGILSGDMKILDSAMATEHNDGLSTTDDVDRRPASFNPIPIFARGANAVAKVLAYLRGKLTGTVSHGPTMAGSIVDLTVRLDKGATLEDIEAAIKEGSEGKFKGILGYTEGDHSRDRLDDTRSSIFNAMPTACSAWENNRFKFFFCCDNHWGYGCRVIDLILHMDSVQP
ncbi:hypothetical protein SLE2022_047430 [Rubroshorea leprosula]